MKRAFSILSLTLLLILPVQLVLPVQGWAAAAHRSVSNTTYASRTNTTTTAPAGIQDGDILLHMCLTAASGTTPAVATPAAGFSTIAGTWPVALADQGGFQMTVWIWYKVASGESGNYVVTHVSNSSQCLMVAASGGAATQPTASQEFNTGFDADADSTALSVTTAGNDALVYFLGTDWADTANNLTPPAGTTPTFSEHTDTTLVYAASGVLAVAGATGAKTMANNSATGSPWSAYLVVVESLGGGGGPIVSPIGSLGLMGVGR